MASSQAAAEEYVTDNDDSDTELVSGKAVRPPPSPRGIAPLLAGAATLSNPSLKKILDLGQIGPQLLVNILGF